MGETISAVVWFSDLRGFTALSESLPNTALLDHLNTYFELTGAAVTKEGGEILKFIGDGVLAIFEITPDADTADRCAAALRAAQSAHLAIASANRDRIADGAPEIGWGLALNLGDVSYGNIGTPDRLDFTVVGPAVNHAARLEALGAQIGETVVLSESVAPALDVPLRELGAHSLKGVALPQKAFAPVD
jgi:adenylate cyclase